MSASTTDNAVVGDDSSQEIVMEAGTGTDFLAAGAGSDNYLMMAGSTGGSSTAILESTTAENIRDAFYNNSDLSLSDEDSIQLREQYNILDVDFARVGSGRGLNLNTLQITSENEDGSVDVFDVVGQYSSFGTSSVEYLVLGAGWEGNGETYRIVTDVNSGEMSGTQGADLLVASDHQDGLTMSGVHGSNVLVGAAGQQNFIVGLGHDVIKNFDANDTITSHSPIAKQGGEDYVRVDGDGNVSANGAHAKYTFDSGATLIVEGMGATGVSFESIGSYTGSIETYQALDFTTDASSSTPTTASAITNETDIISSDTDTFFKGQFNGGDVLDLTDYQDKTTGADYSFNQDYIEIMVQVALKLLHCN